LPARESDGAASFLEYEGEEAAEHVATDGLIELVDDRSGGEQMFGVPQRANSIKRVNQKTMGVNT
jgi:hypothetical protein